MSNTEPAELGEGHSPAAWTAVVIMLIGFAAGTLCFWFDLAWGRVGVRRRRRDRPDRGLRDGQGRLRRQRTEVRHQAPRRLSACRLQPRTATHSVRRLLRRPSVPGTNLLQSLVAGALEDAAARRLDRPYADVERDLDRVASPLDALEFLAPGDRVKIIAEVKRASPSRGAMATIADPAALAADYERGGASAISVLTEGRKFLGSLADLEAVRARSGCPCSARTSSPTRTRSSKRVRPGRTSCC